MKAKFIIVLFIILLQAWPCYGNGLPGKRPEGHLYLVPDTDSKIDVTSETIYFNIGKNSSYADIDVLYNLYNNSEEVKPTYIVFYVPEKSVDIKKVTAVLNGNMLEFKDMEIRDVEFRYQRSYDYKQVVMEAALEPGSDNVLNIKYKQVCGKEMAENSRYYFPQKSFDYFLEPAKAWSSFKNLKIIVDVPTDYKLSVTQSSKFEFAEQVGSKKRYIAEYDKLPMPTLQFELLYSPWFFNGTSPNKQNVRYIVYLLSVLSGLLYGALYFRRKGGLGKYYWVHILMICIISPVRNFFLFMYDFFIYFGLCVAYSLAGIFAGYFTYLLLRVPLNKIRGTKTAK